MVNQAVITLKMNYFYVFTILGLIVIINSLLIFNHTLLALILTGILGYELFSVSKIIHFKINSVEVIFPFGIFRRNVNIPYNEVKCIRRVTGNYTVGNVIILEYTRLNKVFKVSKISPDAEKWDRIKQLAVEYGISIND